jgi:nitrogen regulatory protein P-II 1
MSSSTRSFNAPNPARRGLAIPGVAASSDTCQRMNRIELIMPPWKFEEVKDTLADAGILGMTVREAKVFDRTSRRSEVYRGSSYTVDFTLKVEVIILTRADEVTGILRLLKPLLASENGQESAVCISEVVEAMTISTREIGDDGAH